MGTVPIFSRIHVTLALAPQIYSAGLDGRIVLWNYETQQIEALWRVEEAIHSMVLPSRHTAVLSICWGARKTGRLSLVNLTDDASAESSGRDPAAVLPEKHLCKLSAAGQLALSPDGSFVATADGHRVVVLCLQHEYAVLNMLHTRGLTVRLLTRLCFSTPTPATKLHCSAAGVRLSALYRTGAHVHCL